MPLEWEESVNALQDKNRQWLIQRCDAHGASGPLPRSGDACLLWDCFASEEITLGTLEQCQAYAQSLTNPRKPAKPPVDEDDVFPGTAVPRNIDPECIANLLNRLRGIYTVPITDGGGSINGSMEFTREFPVPPINKEAAELIESLGQRIAQLEAALARTVLDCQNLSKAHWDQHDRLRHIVEDAVTFLPFRNTYPVEAEDHEDLPEDQRAS
jgi:hypothetical protein